MLPMFLEYFLLKYSQWEFRNCMYSGYLGEPDNSKRHVFSYMYSLSDK